MFRDFKELLSVFNAHRVKYLIVGGYAVSLHAQPRATKDLDLLISSDAENSKAVYAALAQFGVPIEGLSAQDFSVVLILRKPGRGAWTSQSTTTSLLRLSRTRIYLPPRSPRDGRKIWLTLLHCVRPKSSASMTTRRRLLLARMSMKQRDGHGRTG